MLFRSLQFGRLTRVKEFPDVPTGRELLSNPSDLALLDYAEISFFMALPFLAPPDVPADRVAALRKAFMDMVKDPAFLDDARKSGFDVTPVSGEDVRALVERMASTPKSVIQRYVDIVAKGRNE